MTITLEIKHLKKVEETKKLDAEEQKKVDEASKKEASKPIVKKTYRYR